MKLWTIAGRWGRRPMLWFLILLDVLGVAFMCRLFVALRNEKPQQPEQIERITNSACSTETPNAKSKGWKIGMNGDFIFVLITIAMFALMIGYVRFCERLR